MGEIEENTGVVDNVVDIDSIDSSDKGGEISNDVLEKYGYETKKETIQANPPSEQAQNDTETTGEEEEITERDEKPVTVRKAPISWNKEIAPKFEGLPSDVQDFILKREAEVQKQFTTNDYHRKTGQDIDKITKHYSDVINDNVPVTQVVSQLLDASRILVHGTAEQKANLLVREARNQGIDLLSYLEHQADVPQEVLNYRERIEQLENQLTTINNQSMMSIRSDVSQAVDNFFSNKEQYPFATEKEVADEMLNQIALGYNIDTAYNRAVRLSDDIFSRVQKENELKKSQENAKLAIQAKGNRYSIGDNTSVINVPVTFTTEEQLDNHFKDVAQQKFGY